MIVIGSILIFVALLAGALAVYLFVEPGPMGAGYIVGFMVGLPAVAVGILGAALVGIGRRGPTAEGDPEADPPDTLPT